MLPAFSFPDTWILNTASNKFGLIGMVYCLGQNCIYWIQDRSTCWENVGGDTGFRCSGPITHGGLHRCQKPTGWQRTRYVQTISWIFAYVQIIVIQYDWDQVCAAWFIFEPFEWFEKYKFLSLSCPLVDVYCILSDTTSMFGVTRCTFYTWSVFDMHN